MRYSSGFARYDHSVCVLLIIQFPKHKNGVFTISIYTRQSQIPIFYNPGSTVQYFQSSFDSQIFTRQYYSPIIIIQLRWSNFLQVNYGNPDSTFEYLKFSLRQSSFDIKIFSPHKYSQITQLCRIKGCSGAGCPPNNFRKT